MLVHGLVNDRIVDDRLNSVIAVCLDTFVVSADIFTSFVLSIASASMSAVRSFPESNKDL